MDNNNLKNISVEWHSILRDLKRNCFVIILAILIGLMGVEVFDTVNYSAYYTSSATLVVSTKVSAVSTYNNLAVTSEMATIIAEVFDQNSVKSRAAEHAGYSWFNGTISTDVLSGTNIIVLSVKSKSPELSYNLLKSVLVVFPEVSDNIFDDAVISVLKSPSMPHGPSNSVTSRDRLMIAFLSGVAATAAIVVLSLIRDTVKTEGDFNTKIDAKLLGTIPHEKKRMNLKNKLKGKKQALLIHSNLSVSLQFVENYHKVSAKLEYMKRKYGDKIFAITSVAENEGKSTTASNIALSLAIKGNKVLLLDFDEKKPALYKIFEADYKEEAEFGNLLAGKIPTEKFMFRRYKKTSLFMALNTKPQRGFRKWLENGNISQVLAAMRQQVDYIIIDTAPISADSSVTLISEVVDETMMVVRTDIVATSAVNDAILTIKETGGNFAGCILNDVYPEVLMFNQLGFDEGGYYYGKRYSSYRYKRKGYGYGYGRYGKHNYGRYGYGRSGYGYGYGSYGARYGNYDHQRIDGEESTPDNELIPEIDYASAVDMMRVNNQKYMETENNE